MKKNLIRKIFCLDYWFLTMTIVSVIGGAVISCKKDKPKKYITVDPVIESINRQRETIIIEINNLDSIRNAKIIEVEALDNDSTLKLFYRLVSE